MDELNEIKDLVARTLEKKNVLSKLRAELRAHVFVAIDEEEHGSGGEGLGKKTSTPQRDGLIGTEEGRMLVGLVREFLDWCNLEFTLKVFEPEIGRVAKFSDRGSLLRQLGLPASAEGPVLLTLMREGGGLSKPGSTAEQPEPEPEEPSRSAGGAAHRPAIVPPLALGLAVKQPPADGASDPPLQRRLEPVGLGSSSGLPPPLPRTVAPSAPPAAVSQEKAPSKQATAVPMGGSEDSYELEVESDEGLDGIEVADEEEEEYAFAPPQVKSKSLSGGGLNASPPLAPRPDGPRSGGGGGVSGDSQELDESGLSSSSLMLQGGRIRPGRKSKQASDAASDSGLNISYGAEPEGGLTLTGDIHIPDKGGDSRGSSLGGAPREDLVKPRGLAPLAPLPGKLAPLAPLAPLGGSRPLKSSGGGGDDIKEELRRAGLLTLPPGDSYSNQSSVDVSGSQNAATAAPPARSGDRVRSGGGVYDAEYSISNSNIEDMLGASEQEFGLSYDVGRSMDLREQSLIQTDRSGDLEHMMEGADFAETAEWD